jgi:hypothetical protein
LGQPEALVADLGNFVSMMERNPESAESFFNEADKLKDLFDQFINQRKEIEIDMGDLGKQKSQYVDLTPKNNDLSKPPIILIPGISNDLDNIGEFPIELAAFGRRVIMIGYPESWMGKVTKDFRNAVEKSEKFEPHIKFFKSAIENLLGGDKQIDMVGVSTGSVIISELMKNENFNFRVNQSNLIIPPGLIEVGSLDVSMAKELLVLTFCGKLKYMKKARVNNPIKITKSLEDRRLSDSTYRALERKVRLKYDWQNSNLISGSGRKTEVIVCEQDKVTKPKTGIKELERNNSLIIHRINGGHLTPGIEAKRVIEQMVI